MEIDHMGYSILGDVMFSKKNRIEKFIPEASAVLGDGSRIDRYIQIDSDGGFHLTTEDVMAVQSKALPVLDQFDDDDVFYIVSDAITEAIENSDCPLLESDTNNFIRQARPREVMESWIEAPTGHIDVDGRTCYAQF
jgi:hypothetical protein